jgi:hypothetical protein
MQHTGIVRKVDEHEFPDAVAGDIQPYVLAIRPAIVDLLGETAITRLAQFTQSYEPAGESNEDGDGQGPEQPEEEEA